MRSARRTLLLLEQPEVLSGVRRFSKSPLLSTLVPAFETLIPSEAAAADRQLPARLVLGGCRAAAAGASSRSHQPKTASASTRHRRPTHSPKSNEEAGALNSRLHPPPEGCSSMETSKEQASKDYAGFEKKVKRTIYIDHLSPQVKESAIKAALAQCANVVHVEFIVNYTIPYKDIASAALVELDDDVQAKAAVELMNDFPFIIGGMPRPVKAIHAKAEMFRDRPPCPGLRKDFCWVKQGDKDYEAMQKLKNLAKRQESENMALIQKILKDEKELATRQQEVLDGNCKKYDMLEALVQKGDITNLAQQYGVNLND